jgi:hypothetical protein
MVDGVYEFRVIASDEAGNNGISEISRNITVDTKAPDTKLIELPELTDLEQITLNITQIEDTVNFTLYYSVVREGQEIYPVEWDIYGNYLITDLPILVSVENQFHYFFKVIAYDLAENHFVNDSYEDIIVDRDPPMKVRNLEITEGNLIENGTVDVILSFMSSQSQDLVGYRIYRSTNQSETGEIIDNMESEALYLSYRDVKVSLGATYYYSVMAVDRMGFESEPETRFIVLEAEEPATVIEEDSESSNNPLFIGMGVIGVIALGGAGFYFLKNKAGDEIITGIGEASPSNFTEMDGEFLCGACGSMFEMTDDKTCPSCGTVDE